jgi:RHS repeat-associated protein
MSQLARRSPTARRISHRTATTPTARRWLCLPGARLLTRSTTLIAHTRSAEAIAERRKPMFPQPRITPLYGPGRHLEMQTNLSSGTVAYDYIWLGDIPVAEEDIAGSNTYWTVVDHLGSPIILTNASGAIAWQVVYRPFGKVYVARVGGSIHQPLRFPGQEDELFDGSNGVNGFTNRSYNGMRWYRSQFARYMQADPIEYAGSPYNLYAYVGVDAAFSGLSGLWAAFGAAIDPNSKYGLWRTCP